MRVKPSDYWTVAVWYTSDKYTAPDHDIKNAEGQQPHTNHTCRDGQTKQENTAQTSQKNKTKTYLSLDSGSTKCPQLSEGTDRASLTWMDTAAAPKKKKKKWTFTILI